MKKALALLLLIPFQLSAVNISPADSLQLLLKKSVRDTNRVNILVQLSSLATDYKSTLEYAQLALELSEELNYIKGIADACNYIGFVKQNEGDLEGAFEYYNKSLEIFRDFNNQREIGYSYNNIGLVEFQKGDFRKASAYWLESLKIMESLHDSIIIATLYNNLASAFKEEGEVASALEYQRKSVRIKESIHDVNGIAGSYVNIALIFGEQEKKDSAYLYLQRCLHIYDSIGNKRGLAMTYYGLGTIIGDPVKTLDYNMKSLAIYEEQKFNEGIAFALANVGNAHAALKNRNEALEYLTRSLELSIRIEKKEAIATAYNSLGKIYEDEGDLQKAIDYYSKGLALKKQIGQKQGVARSLNNLGNLHFRKKNYGMARQLCRESLEISTALGYPKLIGAASDVLGRLYAETGEYKQAYQMQLLYKQMDDSVNSSESAKAVAAMASRYEFDKREALVKAAYDQKEAVSKKEIEKQKLVRNYTAGGFTLLLAGTGVFAFMFNQRRKSRFMHQVSEVEMKALRAQMNPHFIFNSLNSINRYMQAKDTGTASDYLTRFAKVMRMILENSQYPEVPLQDDLKALELYMQLEALRMDNRFSYEVKVDDNIDPEITLVPPLILQPFVENAIWHGFSGKTDPGKIVIRVYKENNMLKCVVEDNGIGREKSAASKQPEKNKKSLGMKITRARIDIINQIKKSNAAVDLIDLAQGMRVVVTLPFEQEY